MSQQLTEFLTSLATDNELVEAFKTDKVATMKQHGLSDEHIALVVNSNYAEIQNILGADYTITSNGIITAFKGVLNKKFVA